MHRIFLGTVLAAALVAGCSSQSDTTAASQTSYGDHAGTYDDIPVDDGDLLTLEQLLSSKWTYFLAQMDHYNWQRDGAKSDEMASKMSYVFADSFVFNAYYADGSEFGSVQGTYSPSSWVASNNASKLRILHDGSTLIVPNFEHLAPFARDDLADRRQLRAVRRPIDQGRVEPRL